MRKLVLLFGEGQGAREYIINNINNIDIVGFIDNDCDKHGTKIDGIPIYSPKQLPMLEYDHIVITTQWASDVQHQLLHELHIAPSKVIIPKKNSLKKPSPFTNPKSIELARHIVKSLNGLAIEAQLNLVIDFGTLLGIVRDNDIIQWDDDIDFSAPVELEAEVQTLCERFIQNQSSDLTWKLVKCTNSQEDAVGLLITFTDESGAHSEFTTQIGFRYNKGGNAIHMPSLGMWYAPEHHFSATDKLSWQGHVLQIPREYFNYLTFLYGDWRTPKRDIQFSDYANTREVSIDEIRKSAMRTQVVDTKEQGGYSARN